MDNKQLILKCLQTIDDQGEVISKLAEALRLSLDIVRQTSATEAFGSNLTVNTINAIQEECASMLNAIQKTGKQITDEVKRLN